MEPYPDEFLELMLEDASQLCQDYCNREDMGEQWDSIVCELATILVNREGAEGSESASEGSLSRSWSGGNLPADLKIRLNNFRMAKGLSRCSSGEAR